MIKDKIGCDSIDENPTKGFQKAMEIFESILKKKGQYLLGNTDGPTLEFCIIRYACKALPGFMGFMPTLYENISILADPNNEII